jgi:hypothetical protein
MIGQRFGRWLVTSPAPSIPRPKRPGQRSGPYGAVWVQCDCGTVKAVRVAGLHRGLTTSCGCRKRELAQAMGRKFGGRNRKDTAA